MAAASGKGGVDDRSGRHPAHRLSGHGSMTAFLQTYDGFCSGLYTRARRRLVPDLANSQYAYRDRLRQALKEGSGRWLDLGCGHDFFPDWMAPDARALDLRNWSATGIDLDASAIRRHRLLRHRVIGDVQRLPFADGHFNLITANMVLEHVEAPHELFAELTRVLADGGLLLLHTPNVRGYTTALTRVVPDRLLKPLASALLGRHPEDVYPTFYRLNAEEDLKSVGAASGLAMDACAHIDSSPQFIRVPPLMLLELLLIRAMRGPSLETRRACLLASFRKPITVATDISRAADALEPGGESDTKLVRRLGVETREPDTVSVGHEPNGGRR
jgi:SAM-dependent methyltransferase